MKDSSLASFKWEPREVEEIAAIDLDRTVLNTDAVVGLVFASLAMLGVDDERRIESQERLISMRGQAVNLFEYLEKEFEIDIEALTTSILSGINPGMKSELLFPGAEELLVALEDRNTPFIIFTHGDKRAQEFKLSLTRNLLDRLTHELPTIITQQVKKSDAIEAGWRDERGGLTGEPRRKLGYLRPKLIIVIDDKEENLRQIDGLLGGVWIDNSTHPKQGAISIEDVALRVANGESLRAVSAVYSEHQREQAS